jgi:hypothetical protein
VNFWIFSSLYLHWRQYWWNAQFQLIWALPGLCRWWVSVCFFVSLGVRGVHRGSWLLSWTICSKCLRVSAAPPLQATAAPVCLLFDSHCWHVFVPYNCSYFIFICFKGGMKWADKSCRAEMTSAMTSAMPLQLWSIDPSFWLFPRGFSRSPLFICIVCFYANSNQTNILITPLDFYKIMFVDDETCGPEYDNW